MTNIIWLSFLGFVLVMVALDLGVFHRKAHVISLHEALAWTAVWIALALAFNVGVYFLYAENWLGWSDLYTHHLTGRQAAVQFLTGYVLEKSLSVDNIFVIAMIFAYFQVPLAHQHRLLFWGVLGAIALRGFMIALGAGLISRFDWIVYLFGALLIFSAAKMLVVRHDNIEPGRNLIVRLVQRFYPVTTEYAGGRFFVRAGGHLAATPMFLALILVESADVLFAIDSIPAIFAVTRDPFLIFTSNVFAILGLRSLYFALAGMMHRFRYLKLSLVFILAYVGVKMMLSHHYPIPTGVSLAAVVGILGVGVLASIMPVKDTALLLSPLLHEMEELAIKSYRQARRVVVLVFGCTLLVVGVIAVAIPAPIFILLLLGLSILGIEFAWARRWLQKIRRAQSEIWHR